MLIKVLALLSAAKLSALDQLKPTLTTRTLVILLEDQVNGTWILMDTQAKELDTWTPKNSACLTLDLFQLPSINYNTARILCTIPLLPDHAPSILIPRNLARCVAVENSSFMVANAAPAEILANLLLVDARPAVLSSTLIIDLNLESVIHWMLSATSLRILKIDNEYFYKISFQKNTVIKK